MKFAIIGTGVMGRGWITQCAMTGHEVHCHDSNTESLNGAPDYCKQLAGKVAKKFKIEDTDFVAKTVDSIHAHPDRAEFVRSVVIHELAHHFGLDDDRLRELGVY